VGQDVHLVREIKYIAAIAASTIVHCQLSIFPGFAIGSLKLNGYNADMIEPSAAQGGDAFKEAL
jgi:hypothetical protein